MDEPMKQNAYFGAHEPIGTPQSVTYQLLPIPAICERRGGHRSKIYAEQKDGLLPRFVKFGRSTLMPSDELNQVLRARAAGADDDEVRRLVAELFEQRQQMRAAVTR
jgi:predicted DNA-binding transcriptional regulator AlpA